MTTRPFFAPLAVLIAGIVGLNVAVDPLSAKSQPRALWDAIGRASGVTDLFVGSSLMARGIDPETWNSARPGAKALNIGFDATFAVEHDILLRKARSLKPAAVYYSFFDLTLSTPAEETNALLTGNPAVFDALDPDTAIRFRARDDLFARWQMQLNGRVPLFRNRFSPWSRVERLRRSLWTIGWPYPRPMAAFEPLDADAFRRQVARATARGDVFSAPVRDLIGVAASMAASIYVIEMPATSRHRERFYGTAEWSSYRTEVESELRRLGVNFIDASAWAPDDEFFDTIHLNRTGAAKFTARLEQALKNK